MQYRHYTLQDYMVDNDSLDILHQALELLPNKINDCNKPHLLIDNGNGTATNYIFNTDNPQVQHLMDEHQYYKNKYCELAGNYLQINYTVNRFIYRHSDILIKYELMRPNLSVAIPLLEVLLNSFEEPKYIEFIKSYSFSLSIFMNAKQYNQGYIGELVTSRIIKATIAYTKGK